jgi:quercetin dioxygenase-like cupin family protein
MSEVVTLPVQVKHWHGAAADCSFRHRAITVPAKRASIEWLEAVTDE